MCGFTGFFSSEGLDQDASEIVRRMAESLKHRGPDDGAEWVDGEAGIAIGFRRLAIVELSASGRQPMLSASGRYVIAFNGEIYNHLELRRGLGERSAWRGNSDTDTLLACIEEWGLETTLDRSVGMFAVALWDRQDRTLSLARDRAGEKPLYYGWQGSTFFFASELKSLRLHPRFQPTLDRKAVASYLRHGYVPGPYSIYEGMQKLVPGCVLTLELGGRRSSPALPLPRAFWSMQGAVEEGTARPFEGTDAEAVERLEALLVEAVQLQRVADVPLGAFLSGGVDSSLVTAIMQSLSTEPVKTFTVGFDEAAYDESSYAKAVAAHLGTDHTELRVTAAEALSVVDRLPAIYDEPFGDSSAIPTYLVSQLARRHVTVALSGDAGDELFGGYGRYHRGFAAWSRLQAVPGPLRPLLRGVATVGQRVPGVANRQPAVERKLQSIAAATFPRIGSLYLEQMSLWKRPERIVMGLAGEHPTALTTPGAQVGRTPIEQMMYTDAVSYLPEDVLAKVDRAAMAVSLETRVPMLDHRVIEYAWSLPLEFKVRNGEGKWILKRLLERHVPRELIDRPKMGFGVPIDEWLRGPLRSWAEDLLAVNTLRTQGVFDPQAVRSIWLDHSSGANDWQYLLWPVLTFQSWLAAKPVELAHP